MEYQKVMLSLPKPLVKELTDIAKAVQGGNKSGFAASAIRAHIDWWRKANHTRKLRAAYNATASESLAIAKEWEDIDDELWQKLDEIEQKK
jgi:metal-responsive CopG/Arc/MetJ family transcriptional regulator